MDDLDLIRGFRRDVRGPSKDAMLRAAARLANAIDDTPMRKPRVRVPSVRLRRIGAVLAVVVATAAALFISTPWKQSPGFLTRAEAALTPPAATVLHMKTVTTYSTKEFGCTVTRGPTEYWIDQAPRHRYHAINEFLPTDPSDPSAFLTVGRRRLACTRGFQAEIGGTPHELLQFVPPNTLRWSGQTFNIGSGNFVASLRAALAAGNAHHEGETQLDGRTVERIRWTPPDCPLRRCDENPVFAYVDPTTLYPIRIDGYLVSALPSGTMRSDAVVRFLTYEYLPRTAANLALTDIHAQHPDATEDRSGS